MYFRYLPMAVLSAIGAKDQFMHILEEQLDFKSINPSKKVNIKKELGEYWCKLHKQANLKGKYKFR